MFDLAAKGKAIFLDADNVESTKSTNLYQLGGRIRNSTFNMLPQPTPLNRLNSLVFQKVKWIFMAYRNMEGNFIGIAPRCQYGEPCSATFIQNIFKVIGDLVTDDATGKHFLIETEYLAEVGNVVTLEFRDCTFDNRFGNEDKTYIAKVISRGQWKFKLSDLMGIPLERALLIKPGAIINTSNGIVKIDIP